MPEPQQQADQAKCCIRNVVHFWDADTSKWTSSKQPTLPTTKASVKGQTCLATVGDLSHPDVTVILAKAEDVSQHTSCLGYFQSKLDMPLMWFTEYSRKSNGFFGSEILADKDGDVRGVTTWCRFIVKSFTSDPHADTLTYMWDKLNMFTKWDSHTDKTTVVIFVRDFDKLIEPANLFRGLEKKHTRDPFWAYTFALCDIADKQHLSIWNVRSAIRLKEKEAEDPLIKGVSKHHKTVKQTKERDFRSLHDLARHAIHGTETLDAAVSVTQSMLEQHDALKEAIMPSQDILHDTRKRALALASHRTTHSSFYYHLSIFRTFLHRASSNKERLLNEINLSFNTVAQSDATISHSLAEAARLDSAAMKTIAFVTTAFLPATFIAALFSTSFFNFEQGTGWAMSGKFWIYWTCAVPVTIFSVAALHYWQKQFIEKGRAQRLDRQLNVSYGGDGSGSSSNGSQDVEKGLKGRGS